LITVIGTLSAVYAIAFVGLLLTMKREYVGTFVSTQTGCAYAQSHFLDNEGKDAKRASIPKDLAELDLEWALKLLGLPREIGAHPESGKPITASIGRYGPYLTHEGKYARLKSTAEVFDTGMNAAVVLLAEAAAGAGARGNRAAAEPLNTFGPHPTSGGDMKLLAGRYGAYVTDGTTNATLPKDKKPEDLTLEEAIALIDERAAKGPPAKGKKKAAPKKAVPKTAAAAVKAPAKEAATKKPAAKKAKKPASSAKTATSKT
jgi:DNA topoisomerase-1